MAELSVTLETVTPLFLGGADPRGQPELRPPAFRGAMRYWLRAALGGVIGDGGWETLQEIESSVFGSAGDGKAGASRVTLRIPPSRVTEYEVSEYRRESKGREAISGRDYLYWTAAATSKEQARHYIEPGAKFALTLEDGPGQGEEKRPLLYAMSALWLLVQLGGIGSRSRRTAGSLAVCERPQMKGLNWSPESNTTSGLANELGKGLKAIRQLLGNGMAKCSAAPEYDVIAPECCAVHVLGIWPTQSGAVEAVGGALRDFRARQKLPERAVFGLPLKNMTVLGSDGKPLERRASPLWLKISRCGNRYAAIATVFRARLLPKGTSLPPGVPADYTLLDEFLGECFPKKAEVRYG